MTATELTPEAVSLAAEEIAATLPADPPANPLFDRSRFPAGLSLPDKGPSQIVEIHLVDQYGNVIARAPLAQPVVPMPGSEIHIPGITFHA
jgi:hypothetical protein